MTEKLGNAANQSPPGHLETVAPTAGTGVPGTATNGASKFPGWPSQRITHLYLNELQTSKAGEPPLKVGSSKDMEV